MDVSPDPNTDFYEVQQFRQPWLILLIIGGCAFSIWTLWLALAGIGKGQPSGPAMNPGTYVLAVEALAMGLLVALFLTTKMITEVRWDGVLVRAYPLTRFRRFIPYSEIASCEARTYSPILEYGGWGIRYGRGGKAYNISGNRGVQLVMKSGERLLIGSQKSDELAAAIQARLRA